MSCRVRRRTPSTSTGSSACKPNSSGTAPASIMTAEAAYSLRAMQPISPRMFVTAVDADVVSATVMPAERLLPAESALRLDTDNDDDSDRVTAAPARVLIPGMVEHADSGDAVESSHCSTECAPSSSTSNAPPSRRRQSVADAMPSLAVPSSTSVAGRSERSVSVTDAGALLLAPPATPRRRTVRFLQSGSWNTQG